MRGYPSAPDLYDTFLDVESISDTQARLYECCEEADDYVEKALNNVKADYKDEFLQAFKLPKHSDENLFDEHPEWKMNETIQAYEVIVKHEQVLDDRPNCTALTLLAPKQVMTYPQIHYRNAEAKELLYTLGVFRGRICIIYTTSWSCGCKKQLIDDIPDGVKSGSMLNRCSIHHHGRRQLHMLLGPHVVEHAKNVEFPVTTLSRSCNFVFVLKSLPSFFKHINMLLGLNEDSPAIMTSLADPSERRYIGPLDRIDDDDDDDDDDNGQVPKLQPTQEQVVANLVHDIDFIQGPPGTGKTTLIAYLLAKTELAHSTTVVTSVTNQALEAVAVKLTYRNSKSSWTQVVPFIVYGSNQNESIGVKSKYWTLEAQIKRDERVQRIEKRISIAWGQNIPPWKQPKRIQALEKARKEAKDRILSQCKVILSTTSNLNNIVDTDDIETVIVDEAGTMSEMEMPLLAYLDPSRIIAIGDVQQLPPFTCIEGFERSDFSVLVRVYEALGEEELEQTRLREQWRMHPDISNFISEEYYENGLHCSNDICQDRLEANVPVKGLCFLDTADGVEIPYEKVKFKRYISNPVEIRQIKQALNHLINWAEYQKEKSQPIRTIAILTFYRDQKELMKEMLADYIEPLYYRRWEMTIDTVDSFQGNEADVVMVSCVRSNRRGYIGFLNKEGEGPNRINVAISRARYGVILVGDSETLRSSPHFHSFLENPNTVQSQYSAQFFLTQRHVNDDFYSDGDISPYNSQQSEEIDSDIDGDFM